MRELLDFLVRHGYIVVGAAVLVEQLGIPVPSMPVLLAAGALSGLGTLNLGVSIAVALVAALLGDLVWFTLGRRYGSAVLGILCRISLEPDSCVQNTENVYSRYGTWTLVFAKFVPGLSTVMTPLAGRFRLQMGRFLLFDGLGALLWTGTYVSIGWLFRSELERLADKLYQMGAWFGILAVALLALYLGYRYSRRRHLYRELRLSRIAPWELKERLDRGEDVLVIDVRNPVDYDQGMIPGARLLPMHELAARAPGIVGDSEVVLYCS